MKKSFLKGFTLIDPSSVTDRIRVNKGFTLIELLVVISIIALLTSVVLATITKARILSRDSARIQNARQIAIALEQYEATNNTYKVANSGLGSNGSGYVAKSGGSYGTSILSTLKSEGLYTNPNLTDPIYGTDNYYLGLCTSTNAYNVFVKLEQPGFSQSTSSISNTCGGAEASALGFGFIASTAGGSSGGGGISADGGSGFGGAYEVGMSAPVSGFIGPDGLTYETVDGPDGRIWLDRNLGASRIATAYNDYQAYGDLYQWGRASDGHNRINHTSATAASAVNGSTSTLSSSDTPGHNLFIRTTVAPDDWINPQNNNLWRGVSGVNNPCPSGFRVPNHDEWSTLISSAGITNYTTAYNSALKLTPAGRRLNNDPNIYNLGGIGFYWASDVNGTFAYDMEISSTGVIPANWTQRSHSFSIRCIKY